MAGDPGEGIFRAMIEDDDGMPMRGSNAETLGIRRNKDIIPDQSGMVARPRFQPGSANGLWCAPTIQDLPRFALPTNWGGRNRRTVIWRIDASDLGPDLVAAEDTGLGRTTRHVSVGPARTMSLDDYVKLIEATRSKWKKVAKT
jgi:hypothetical protein